MPRTVRLSGQPQSHFDEATPKLANSRSKAVSPRLPSILGKDDPGTAANSARTPAAGLCLFGSTESGPSPGGLPGMQELFPKIHSPVPHRNDSTRKGQPPTPARFSRGRSGPLRIPALEKLVDLDMTDKRTPRHWSDGKQIDRNLKVAPLRDKERYIWYNETSPLQRRICQGHRMDSTLESAYIMLAGSMDSNRQEQAIERLTAFTDKNKDVPALMQLATIHEQRNTMMASGVESLVVNQNCAGPQQSGLSVFRALGARRCSLRTSSGARLVLPEEPHIADTLGHPGQEGQYREALRLLKRASKCQTSPVCSST